MKRSRPTSKKYTASSGKSSVRNSKSQSSTHSSKRTPDSRQHGRDGATGRNDRKGPVRLYTPKTFKGAQSREEELRLAEGTVQRIALGVLNRFEETDERMDLLIQRSIHVHTKLLGAREKANLTRTLHNVIRWKLKIDYIVSKSLKMDSDSLDLTLKNAYRLATLNMVWLHKSPAQAISLSDFAIPKEFGKHKETVRQYIKFLNKAKNEIPYPNAAKNPVNAFSIVHSHPSWLIEKWISCYGAENTVRLCEYNNSEPPLTLRVNTLKNSVQEARELLGNSGFAATPCRHARHGLMVEGKNEIYSLSSFKSGDFEVQDESSQLFAAWCDPHPDHVIIDACAGTGGKTLYFSALMHDRGKIIASDRNRRALEKLRKRASRAGCSNIEIMDLDDSVISAEWSAKADKVIVDAPCSGLGTLARNPDIKWRIDHDSFASLAAEQISLLTHFASFVKPGGELIYGTCTLNPDENEHVIRHFLSADDRFRLTGGHDRLFDQFMDENGYFYIKPFEKQLGGFFGCKLVRNK